MKLPVCAKRVPAEIELEEGKKYFFCTCGLSEKQPFCDGAHKGTNFKPQMFACKDAKKVWLCQCKATNNAPYCDGSHNNLDDSE